MWLDMRRRILASAAYRRELNILNDGMTSEQSIDVEIPQYSRDAECLKILASHISERKTAPAIKFLGGLPAAVLALEQESDDVDLQALREARQVHPPAAVLRRRNCVRKWGRMFAAFRAEARRQNRWAAFDILQGSSMREEGIAATARPAAVALSEGVERSTEATSVEVARQAQDDSESSSHSGEEVEEESDVELEVEWELS
jgi:hypothetical protein